MRFESAGYLFLLPDDFIDMFENYEQDYSLYSGLCAIGHVDCDPEYVADYWSKRTGSPVTWLDPRQRFIVMERKYGFLRILARDREGWIHASNL
jgi:hypothetical protein